MEIKTERLTIKKIKKTDKKQLVDLIGDFRVSKTLSNVPYPYTDKDAEYWVNDAKNSKFKLNIFLDNILIGGELKNVHQSTANKFILKESQWFNIDSEIAGRAMKDVFKNYKILVNNVHLFD